MKKNFFLCFLAFAVCSSSCDKSSSDKGKDSGKVAKDQPVVASSVLTGEWFIINVNDTKTATDENTPFIIFDNQNLKFNGFTGCNRIFGDMVFDSKERNSIEFNQMGSTKMTCPDNQIETEIIKALDSVTSVENGNCPETEPQCIYLCSIDGKRVLLLQKRISQKVEKSLIEEQAVEEE